MARAAIYEYLQSHAFWLMDVGPTETMSAPVLTPLFGFSGISMPQITLETQDINDGTWPITRKVIKRGAIDNITLMRGTVFYDNDFWRWIMTAVAGDTSGVKTAMIIPVGGPTYRRTLLLLQYYGNIFSMAAAVGIGIEAFLSTSVTTSIGASAAFGVAQGLGFGNVGPFEFAARVPAKAWLLKDVIPVRYKAGSDFSGDSAAVSVAELELAVELFEEVSLSAEVAVAVAGNPALAFLL